MSAPANQVEALLEKARGRCVSTRGRVRWNQGVDPGSHLLPASVRFNGVAATAVSNSGSTYVPARVPAGAASGRLRSPRRGTVTTRALRRAVRRSGLNWTRPNSERLDGRARLGILQGISGDLRDHQADQSGVGGNPRQTLR